MSKIEMVRSDQGDGGWSLHPAGYADEDYAAGNVPLLASGTATYEGGEWDRPNESDYADAERQMAQMGAAAQRKQAK